MTLFRRTKTADATRGNKSNDYNNQSTNEEALRGQVEDLQEEMKVLNERLVAMQAKVQHKATVSPTNVNFPPTPSFSPRPRPQQELRNGRTPLSSEKLIRNRSLRKKKGIEGIFVPHEIDFVSNELSNLGKSMDSPDIRVSNIFQDGPHPPVEDIDAKKKNVTPKNISRGNSHSKKKVKTSKYYTNLHKHSSKVIRDSGSTTGSQRSTSKTKSGPKVRRIVRKVRAATPPESTTKPSSTSRVFMAEEREKTNSSLSPTIRGNTIGLERSRKNLSSGLVNDMLKLSFCTEASARTNEIKNDDDSPNCLRQTRTSPFAHHSKEISTADSMLSDRTEEKKIDVGVKESREQEKISCMKAPARKDENLLDQTHLKIIDRPGAGMKLPRPDLGDPILAQTQTEAKLERVQNSAANSLNSTTGVPAALSARVESSNQIEKPTQKTQNPKSGLLADIRSGIKLNKVTKSSEENGHSTPNSHQESVQGDLKQQQSQDKNSAVRSSQPSATLPELKTSETSQIPSQNPKNPILEGIRAGVKLKQVGRSSHSTAKLPEQKATKTSPIASQNPKNTILEGIKAGVKLKQVDRSSLHNQKKHETPMSALLATIQKRKQQCLRQEQPFIENPEQSEIDW